MCLLASWIQRYHLSDYVLWKDIVDYKYMINHPNIFCCLDNGTSPFWKGVLWAAQAARNGYCWNIGNGRRVRFWEDQWFVALVWLSNTGLFISFVMKKG